MTDTDTNTSTDADVEAEVKDDRFSLDVTVAGRALHVHTTNVNDSFKIISFRGDTLAITSPDGTTWSLFGDALTGALHVIPQNRETMTCQTRSSHCGVTLQAKAQQ